VRIPTARFRADASYVNPRPLVLIADDDPDILLLLRVRLERSGYEVIAAHDGPEALALAWARSPDLAILDITMPGMTGVEVTRALREGQFTRPVILLTALTQNADVAAGAAAGADAYLTKPFSPQELESRVRALVNV
jgi:DNA-binding response OmpR family regulator